MNPSPWEGFMEMPCRFAPRFLLAGVVSLILVSALVRAEPPPRPAPRPLAEWVKKSNQNAKIMVELMAKLQPEQASQFGVEGYDDQILDLSPGFVERQIK